MTVTNEMNAQRDAEEIAALGRELAALRELERELRRELSELRVQ